MRRGTEPANHRPPNHRSCATAYTRQRTRPANPSPTGTGRRRAKLAPAPLDANKQPARDDEGPNGTSSKAFRRATGQEPEGTAPRPRGPRAIPRDAKARRTDATGERQARASPQRPRACRATETGAPRIADENQPREPDDRWEEPPWPEKLAGRGRRERRNRWAAGGPWGAAKWGPWQPASQARRLSTGPPARPAPGQAGTSPYNRQK